MSNFICKQTENTFYEPLSAQKFKCTMVEYSMKVKQFNDLRLERRLENLCLNEWLDILGLTTVEIGEHLRWEAYEDVEWIDINIVPALDKSTNEPVYELDYGRLNPRMLSKYSSISREVLVEMLGETQETRSLILS